jgi:ureidoacrylate peracid hydrolase
MGAKYGRGAARAHRGIASNVSGETRRAEGDTPVEERRRAGDASRHDMTRRPEPLDTLEKKLDPAHCALLVIDVLNDFCADDGAMAREGLDVVDAQQLAGRLPALIDAARAAGALVVFVRNVYSTEGNTYLSDVWLEQAQRRREGSYVERPVCPPDSWGNDFYGGVGPLPGEPIVTKHRFDAFLNTDLDLVLRSNAVRSVVVTGVATNVCVETSARQAFVREYYVVLPSDGAAAYSAAEHEASLATIDRYFGQVVSCDDVIGIWERTRVAAGRP